MNWRDSLRVSDNQHAQGRSQSMQALHSLSKPMKENNYIKNNHNIIHQRASGNLIERGHLIVFFKECRFVLNVTHLGQIKQRGILSVHLPLHKETLLY